MSYSSETYASDTYATEAPIVKHGAPFSVFEWARSEPEPVEPIQPRIQRPLEVQHVITVKVRHVIKAMHNLGKLQRYFFKTAQTVARFGVSFEDIVKGYEAYQESKKKKRTIKPNHNSSMLSWWQQASYCNCLAFGHIHAVTDCRTNTRQDHE